MYFFLCFPINTIFKKIPGLYIKTSIKKSLKGRRRTNWGPQYRGTAQWWVNWPRLRAEGASSPEMPMGKDKKAPTKGHSPQPRPRKGAA